MGGDVSPLDSTYQRNSCHTDTTEEETGRSLMDFLRSSGNVYEDKASAIKRDNIRDLKYETKRRAENP
jgi:hypothetical protein